MTLKVNGYFHTTGFLSKGTWIGGVAYYTLDLNPLSRNHNYKVLQKIIKIVTCK
jgi:hypothetical protein